MGGGLMQLVAYGAQDVYLTGNPQITFWKVTYRRHTNFAVESIEQTFNGQADFGRRVQCTVSRNGDLAYRTYLQVTLPEVDGSPTTANDGKTGFAARWLDYPGEQLVSTVEVEIGGQRIDRQYGDWMHIWNQLSLSDAQRRGYNKMVGQTTQLTYLTNPLRRNTVDSPCAAAGNTPQTCELRRALPQTTLYVPLQFWFCRNPGLAIPLIALQYHEVKINLEFNTLDQCLWAVNTNSNGLPVFDTGGCTAPATGQISGRAEKAYNSCCLVSASLFIDYVFLDTDERRRMAQNPHEYLIEQLQFTGDESIGSTSNKIKLNFNHPCKELVWVVQPDEHVDYCGSFSEQNNERASCWDTPSTGGGACCGETNLYSLMGAQPFNYTDATDQIPRSWNAYGNHNLVSNELILTKSGNCCATISRLANPWACTVACNTVSVFNHLAGLDLGGSDGEAASRLAAAYNALQTAQAALAVLGQGGSGYEPSSLTWQVDYNAAVAAVQDALDDVEAAAVPDQPWVGHGPRKPEMWGGEFKIGPAPLGVPTGADVNRRWDTDTSIQRDAPGGVNVSDFDEKTNSSVSTAGTIVLGQTSRGMNCWGENPVVTAKLLLNGQDRFSERLGSYFDVVQPYQHHTANPSTGINVYSFALRPEEHQPSGTCNFSRIDNASLQLVVSSNAVGGSSTSKVRVYATNYNVLRVMSGMGGLAYSN
jgi:hypothetical protein